MLNKSTLHEVLCSKELKIVSEDDLLKILIELGSEYLEYWCYIEVSFLSSSGISLFVEHLQFEELNEMIWFKVVDRLKMSEIRDIGEIHDLSLKSTSKCQRYLKVTDRLKTRETREIHEINDFRLKSTSNCQHQLNPVGFESVILKDYPMILKEFSVKTWKLLYRGSRDGFRSSNFHEKCDNRSNTLTLIETTKNFIFGGFTPIEWDSSSGYKPDNSGLSFLFSLKNPRNSEPRKFILKSGRNAICCDSSYGPIFAGYSDIGVLNNCNTSNSNWTNLGGSYVNDTGIDGKLVVTGEYNFTVKKIELFTITLSINLIWFSFSFSISF
jgi:hypothetical protein